MASVWKLVFTDPGGGSDVLAQFCCSEGCALSAGFTIRSWHGCDVQITGPVEREFTELTTCYDCGGIISGKGK